MTPLAAPTPDTALMPFMDPAFATAVCRYDLTQGPIKLSVPVSPAYTSVSFYTRYDVAYYAINDRAAGRRVIELDLMTHEQHNDLPEDEDVTAADRLIVESADADRLDRDPRAGARAGPDADGAGGHSPAARCSAQRAVQLISARRRGFARGPRSARLSAVIAISLQQVLSARSTSTACGDGAMITSRSSAKPIGPRRACERAAHPRDDIAYFRGCAAACYRARRRSVREHKQRPFAPLVVHVEHTAPRSRRIAGIRVISLRMSSMSRA